jgi:hypothetical protein
MFAMAAPYTREVNRRDRSIAPVDYRIRLNAASRSETL